MGATRSEHRWVGVGRSAVSASPEAAAEAVRAACAGRDATLLMVFASEAHDLPACIDALAQLDGGDPIVVLAAS